MKNENMVLDNINLVYKVYNDKFRSTDLSYREDRIQQGMLGLCLAAKRYDPKLGAKFSTLAYKYIYFYMLRKECWQEDAVLVSEDSFFDIPIYDNYDIMESKSQFEEIMSLLPVSERRFMIKHVISKKNTPYDRIKFKKLCTKVRLLYNRKEQYNAR